MTTQDFLQDYWKYYIMLEEKFLRTLTYVELSKSNYSTYSMEYAHIIQSVGAELETVLQYIDLCMKTAQSKVLARFYRGYINSEISWEVFEELSDINSRMLLCDYEMIKTIVLIPNYQNISDQEEPMISRLTSLGLTIDNRVKGSALVTEDSDNDGVVLSVLGKVLGRYLNVSKRDIDIKIERNSRYDLPKYRK